MALHYLDLLLTLLRFLHFKICDSQEHPNDLDNVYEPMYGTKHEQFQDREDLQHHKGDPDLNNLDSGVQEAGRMDAILTTLLEGGAWYSWISSIRKSSFPGGTVDDCFSSGTRQEMRLRDVLVRDREPVPAIARSTAT